MARLESLQAGRALAALAVVVHHANLAATGFGGWSFAPFNFGYLGVDFFFVLSGFIIAYSTPGKGPADYSWHRFRRVYLPYWPIGIGMALLYLFLPAVSAGNREWSWLPTLTLLPVESDTALSVAWTLQHEVTFYAIFGLAWFGGMLWPAMALWAAAIVGGTLAGIDLRVLDPINLEFLMGMGALAAYRRGFGPAWLFALALVPLGLFAALGGNANHSPLVGLGLAIGLPAVLKLERDGMRVPGVLVFLGAASYSLYLAHPLAVAIAARAAPAAIFPVALAAGVAAGLAYYLAVERTALKLTPKNIRGRRREKAEEPAAAPYPE